MSVIKKFIFAFLVILLGGLIYYSSLSPLKKNLAKNKILHWTHILSPDWEINVSKEDDGYVANLNSPSLLVDGIYNSMKGPVAYKMFLLDENEDELYWVTGLDVKANSKYDSKGSSDDLICHVNLYHSPVEHFSRMGMEERIDIQLSQLITLTKGGLFFEFPEGFGYPLYSNEKIYVGSQVLNLNLKNPLFTVDYDFKLKYIKDKEKRLKPLYMRYVVLVLPYDAANEKINDIIKKNESEDEKVRCAIPRGENHGYNSFDEKRVPTTAFWIVPKGKHTYRSNFTKVLALDTIETVHKINTHVHPYATSLEIRDITADSTIFKSIITNHKDRIGIDSITSFSSVKGVKMYPDHEYELVEEVDNTSGKESEMMASMFLYFYDHKLDKKIDSLQLKQH